jgi:hypothetical protein
MDSHGNNLTFTDIRSARNNLELLRSYVDLADDEMVCIRVLFYF